MIVYVYKFNMYMCVDTLEREFSLAVEISVLHISHDFICTISSSISEPLNMHAENVAGSRAWVGPVGAS